MKDNYFKYFIQKSRNLISRFSNHLYQRSSGDENKSLKMSIQIRRFDTCLIFD